jgi:hypothetical protein
MKWKLFDLFVTLALFWMTVLLVTAFMIAYFNDKKVLMDFNSIGEAKFEFGMLIILLLLGMILIGKKLKEAR